MNFYYFLWLLLFLKIYRTAAYRLGNTNVDNSDNTYSYFRYNVILYISKSDDVPYLLVVMSCLCASWAATHRGSRNNIIIIYTRQMAAKLVSLVVCTHYYYYTLYPLETAFRPGPRICRVPMYKVYLCECAKCIMLCVCVWC